MIWVIIVDIRQNQLLFKPEFTRSNVVRILQEFLLIKTDGRKFLKIIYSLVNSQLASTFDITNRRKTLYLLILNILNSLIYKHTNLAFLEFFAATLSIFLAINEKIFHHTSFFYVTNQKTSLHTRLFLSILVVY